MIRRRRSRHAVNVASDEAQRKFRHSGVASALTHLIPGPLSKFRELRFQLSAGSANWQSGHGRYTALLVRPRVQRPSPARRLASSPKGRGGGLGAIDAMHREIDRVVYGLYGLTEKHPHPGPLPKERE